jgi:Domain of unknown function (DUF1906)
VARSRRASPKPWKIGIRYFDPLSHAGTEDGQQAFDFAGKTLRQPPHTPIFFTIDGDPTWDHVVDPHAHPPRTEGDWIVMYFQSQQRDLWNAANPGRPFQIGVYAGGKPLLELYKLGIVDMYWQAMSPGFDGSQTAQHLYPWFHLNRWQYNGNRPYNCAHHTNIPLADPDAAWGDGGEWLLTDPLERDLERNEDDAAHFQQMMQKWIQLLPGL